jgi:hypothetical protein
MINNGELINPTEQISPDINGIGRELNFLSSNVMQSLLGKHPTQNPEINPQETPLIIIFLIFGVTKFIIVLNMSLNMSLNISLNISLIMFNFI